MIEGRLEEFDYFCGDPVFTQGDALYNKFVVREDMICYQPIENRYLNFRYVKGRANFPPSCVYCAANDANKFVKVTELNGFKNFPICADCSNDGKKVLTKTCPPQLVRRRIR